MSDIDIRKVKRNIKKLEELDSKSLLDTQLALKFAHLECCGWIEEKMHSILYSYIDRNVKGEELVTFTRDTIRRKNYGFKYGEFKEKLELTIGLVEIKKIEACISKYPPNKFDFDHFKNVLAGLKKSRDSYAHTYHRSGLATPHGFSKLYGDLDYVHNGLNIFQEFIRRR